MATALNFLRSASTSCSASPLCSPSSRPFSEMGSPVSATRSQQPLRSCVSQRSMISPTNSISKRVSFAVPISDCDSFECDDIVSCETVSSVDGDSVGESCSDARMTDFHQRFGAALAELRCMREQPSEEPCSSSAPVGAIRYVQRLSRRC
eukprot:TRINITY_DN7096_c0_g1_i4.p2 TRINITY_DN7096_c0_g1~~TRINITY_DN7096_c0_g1_i4.p2  ORF type:complete len:150 (+),score=19.53 TRINITY_DN7096_c0_g1_i4:151-600(+)